MACDYYYNTNTTPPEVVDKNWVAFYGGIDPSVSTPEQLSAAGFYCWTPGEFPTYDPMFQTVEDSVTISGNDAIQTYTVVDLGLPFVQTNAIAYEKEQAAIQVETVCQRSGYCQEILTATASKAELDRDPLIQATLTTQNAYVDRMTANIAAIGAATTVEEIEQIIASPVGVLNTGRGGSGQAGPLDLNPSYLASLSLPYTAAELELFVPATATTIPYNPGLPSPYEFDSSGNCFAVGDYTLLVRVVATGYVIGTLTVPEGENEDVGFS